MRFVHKKTGIEVKRGDTVTERSGHAMIVSGFKKPHSPASSGRIYVVRDEFQLERASTLGQGFFPNVFDCEWIEREDRDDAPEVKVIDMREMRAAYASEAAERGEPYNERDGG